MTTPDSVIDFWFSQTPEMWWKKDDDFDALIQTEFGACHNQATQCELFAWRTSAEGRLAEIIVLDQFSRNIYRGTPKSFASDTLALALAQEAIATGDDQKLTPIQRSFLYLPFMHSESLPIHDVAVELYTKNGLKENLEYEFKHKVIIERFGRYPHRNEVLGRVSTPEEIEFLKTPGSSF